jgi:signal transduction histidine kinase
MARPRSTQSAPERAFFALPTWGAVVDPAPVVTTFLEDVSAYIGFDRLDSERLASLHPVLAPEFDRMAEHFYACILRHEGAHQAITGGDAQVQRLKRTLTAWMDSGLRGPHDDAFFELRARIGRRHVEIGLPQQYMVTAIGVMRQDYHAVIERAFAKDPDTRSAGLRAVDRLLDLELAIMLQTYRLDSEDRLRRNERLATIGMVAATIGHDLRNPLGVIESSAYILRRVVDDDRGLRHLDKITNQVRACNRIVTALLELARARPPQLSTVDARSLVKNALAMVAVPDQVQLEIDIDGEHSLLVDVGLLEQAIVNLVTNAIQALARPGGLVVIRVGRHDEAFDALTVLDNGPGFDPGMLPRVFEPLVTSRPSGVGLGLALVLSVAERHRGVAVAENRAEGGAMVRILLPSKVPEGAAA